MEKYIENRIKQLEEYLRIVNRSSLDEDLPKDEKEACEEVCMKLLFAIDELKQVLKYNNNK